MFGYVLPCKMELKIKDYEKFKAYYCGVCMSIKNQFGQLPRSFLNYDMTFLAILMDSFTLEHRDSVINKCIVHPFKKKAKFINNKCINYAAFCNVSLAYYKLIDDVNDDNNFKSKAFSKVLKLYMKNDNSFSKLEDKIQLNLKELSNLEANCENIFLDQICDPFAKLTGEILSFYYASEPFAENLYWLGYNLGKWIYLIDAWDDLDKDMEQNKFNPLNVILNKENLTFKELESLIKDRIEDLLTICASNCYDALKSLPLKRNEDLLENILQFGLLEKMDKVFKRSDLSHERSI